MPLTEQQRSRLRGDLRNVPLGFAALILVGAILLRLPWCHQPDATLSFVDAFFLSTSASCVTGLAPVNIATTLNTTG